MYLFNAKYGDTRFGASLAGAGVNLSTLAISLYGSTGASGSEVSWSGMYQTASQVVKAVRDNAPRVGWTVDTENRLVRDDGVAITCGSTIITIQPINERMLVYEVSTSESDVRGEVKW